MPGVREPGLLVEGADVRPLVGHAVDAGDGQLPARALAADAPLLQLPDASSDQLLRRLRRIRPVRVARRGLGPE